MKSNRCFILVILTWLLLVRLPLEAQSIKFSPVHLPPNLDVSWITDLKQDQQGNLWLTTSTGLHRYNGYEWNSYYRNPTEPGSYIDNELESVCPSRDGSVWVGTAGWGLERLDPATGKIRCYRLANDHELNNKENYISVLREGRDGTLWIGTYNGLYSRNPHTGRFTHYAHNPHNPHSLSFNEVRSIWEDRSGAIWVGTGEPSTTTPDQGGLNKLDRRTGRFTRYMHDPKDPNSLYDNRVRAVFEDSRGTLWVGTWGDGLHTMDRQTGKFTRHHYNPLTPDKLSRPYLKIRGEEASWGVSFITEDAAENIWIGAYDGGLNRYNPRTGHLEHYDANEGGGSERVENNQWSACISRDGVLWLGSADGVLMKGIPQYEPIPFHNANVKTINGINTFCEYDPGKFWIGTYAGLKDESIGSTNSLSIFQQAAQQTTLLTDQIQDIKKDRQGYYWFSTLNAGLYQYSPKTGRFLNYLRPSKVENSLINRIEELDQNQLPDIVSKTVKSSTTVLSTYEDRDGSLWVLTANGLSKLNRQTGQFINYQHIPRKSTSITPGIGTCAFEDHTGQFWVGTSHGLNRMDRRSGNFSHYLINEHIVQLGEVASGTLWVVTGQGRLLQYDQQKNQFLPFMDPELGIELSSVASFVEDDDRNLWIATSQGFYCVNSLRNTVQFFGSMYGFKGSSSPYFASAFKSSNGYLLFGGRQGYYKLDPKLLLAMRKNSVPLLLSQLSVANKRVIAGPHSPLQEPVNTAKSIQLDYNQNTFSFDFVAFDYSQTEQIQYSFYLENYEPEWRAASTEHRANFYNIPPGEYIFRVKAGTNDSGWTEKSIAVTIHPPFWQTWWFRLLLLMSLLGLAFVAIRFYTRSRMLRQRQDMQRVLQAQEEERQRLAADLHDDLGATLSAIKGQLESVPGQTHELMRPIGLMDKAIRDLRLISHNLMPPEFMTLGLTEALRETTQRLQASSGLRCLFISYGKEQRLDHPTELTIYRIILELINNTIKHAKASQVTVQLIFYPENVTLLVEDNGRGYPKGKQSSGIGLRNIRSRVDYLGGQLWVDTGERGTTVTLEVPIRQVVVQQLMPVNLLNNRVP
ncbi:sensor histidine kinase [Telluribacter sp.]|jgi:signal transduction histidine kinase/ligand-binding sensor domain-containing protein|uniref:sensor histidine kinase n=1 Tax=Telluribacter sp. TaxID=1978767 RepID=UPI002E12CDED|nr:two-component regulator propeller domain-containing protein [Telluribacter sp.]